MYMKFKWSTCREGIKFKFLKQFGCTVPRKLIWNNSCPFEFPYFSLILPRISKWNFQILFIVSCCMHRGIYRRSDSTASFGVQIGRSNCCTAESYPFWGYYFHWHCMFPVKVEIFYWSNLPQNSNLGRESFVQKSGVRIPVGEGQIFCHLSFFLYLFHFVHKKLNVKT